jgi:1,2-diacylglycerol 3-alpha-glucosyltransferase
MRIGMLADVYKPYISGITNYISLNKSILEKRGHEVFVFTFTEAEYVDEEKNIIRSPGLPLLDTGYKVSLHYTPQARKLLYTMDVAHVHHPFLSGSLARLYCPPRNIPIIFTNHTRYDLYSLAYLPPMADTVGLAAVKAYLPAFCRACDLVISPSYGMREVLVNFGVDVPIKVVPNGVDLMRFQTPIEPASRQEMGYSDEDVILVYVGRLGPEKNMPFLLRAFSGTYQAYNNARLMLIGDGPERQVLEDLVQQYGVADAVKLMGAVQYDQIPRYLAMADGFTTASVTEVLPLTVIEAMAAGLPVLGISSPGITDMVKEGITGLLVAHEDLASYTAKMVRMIREKELRLDMGANASISALDYAIERTSNLMEEHYRQVIARSRTKNKSLSYRITRMWDRLIR